MKADQGLLLRLLCAAVVPGSSDKARSRAGPIFSRIFLLLSRLESPLGEVLLVTDVQENMRALDFSDHRARLFRGLRERYGDVELTEGPAPAGIAQAFVRYFAGELDALEALPTVTAGSELQHRVWRALRHIRAGTTATYGRLAKDLGFDDPRAAIDIGAAIGANPVGIVVPCHRVIASNGDLKGYAWGLHRKRWLLEHERAISPGAAVAQNRRLPGF